MIAASPGRRDFFSSMDQHPRIAILFCALLMAAHGFGEGPTTAPAEKVFRLGAVSVDRAANTVTIPARVVTPSYMLEFLLCRSGTKEYESLLATDANPHDIHAALLLLGLVPGIPAETVGETFYPPRGPKVAIELHWTDKNGKAHSASAGDWLAFSENVKEQNAPAKLGRWVFLGSEISPAGRYAADEDGGIIAVANVATAVLDVPLASTKTLQQRRFVPNTTACPPAGTKVELLLRPDKNAPNAPFARALLEIDPHGNLLLDNEPIAMDKLSAWADAFTTRHKQARVVIRSAAQTPAGLTPQAQLELKLGGVYDFEFRVAPTILPLLPQTQEQLAAAQQQWRERFTNPDDQLDDPAVLARDVLRQIQQQRDDLHKQDALLTRYAEFLQQQADAKKQTTGK